MHMYNFLKYVYIYISKRSYTVDTAKEIDPVIDLISVFLQSVMKFLYMHSSGKDN